VFTLILFDPSALILLLVKFPKGGELTSGKDLGGGKAAQNGEKMGRIILLFIVMN
jgi:hypothetical protein